MNIEDIIIGQRYKYTDIGFSNEFGYYKKFSYIITVESVDIDEGVVSGKTNIEDEYSRDTFEADFVEPIDSDTPNFCQDGAAFLKLVKQMETFKKMTKDISFKGGFPPKAQFELLKIFRKFGKLTPEQLAKLEEMEKNPPLE